MAEQQDLVRLVDAADCDLEGRAGEVFTVLARRPRSTQIRYFNEAGDEIMAWFDARRFETVTPAAPVAAPVAAPAQAMRFNAGKPQLSYLLSFEGGILSAFENSLFCGALSMLSRWYRGETNDIEPAITALLGLLRTDWPELLCLVSMFGAQKYARGNYLKGRGWSDTCDSLLRHIRDLERGLECDADSGLPHAGHIAWNLLFLQHCVLTMPHFDDRLRAPEAA